MNASVINFKPFYFPRLKPCTDLGLAETTTTSTTERSTKQTAKENVRDDCQRRDSCKLDVNKKSKGTCDVKTVNLTPITRPKEGKSPFFLVPNSEYYTLLSLFDSESDNEIVSSVSENALF